jgi:predicted nucleotidyltransferase
MTLNEAVTALRQHEAELRARGVRRAAIFGSVARNEARAGSDVDVLVELDPDSALDIFSYATLKQYIAGLFVVEVDVVNRAALKPQLRGPADRDAVYAF